MEYHRVFYINIDNMDHKQCQDWLDMVTKQIKKRQHPDIIDYLLPVRNQPTKVEFINPTLTTKKQLQRDLDASVEELTSYLKDEIILIHPHAIPRINTTDF